MTGGEGSDTFVFANNATGQPDATTFDTINDWVLATRLTSLRLSFSTRPLLLRLAVLLQFLLRAWLLSIVQMTRC